MIRFASPSSASSLRNIQNEALTPIWKYKTVKKIGFSEISPDKSTRSGVSFILSSRSSRRAPTSNEVLHLVQQKINDKIDAFLSGDEYQRLLAAWKGDTSYFYEHKWRTKSLSNFEEKNIVTVFEDVLDLYQIRVNILNHHSHDSAISIHPVKIDSLAFHQYLNILLLQIIKFPNTFFRKIGLKIISFCESVTLHKSAHKDIYYKRVLSGLFEVDKQKTLQEIKTYFYKFICYHIAQRNEGFCREWAKINHKEFSYTKEPRALACFETLKGFLNIECMKSQQMDQAQILEKLMIDHKRILNNDDEIIRQKANFLMEHLLKIDSSFHMLKGWEENSSIHFM